MNKPPQIYFVSGVSGIGKTTTIPYLQALLPADRFEVINFDERGVPDGGGKEWHDAETRHWLDVGIKNAAKGKSTLITGFSTPEIVHRVSKQGDIPFNIFYLHASGETIRKRLIGRYRTPESLKEINRAAGKPLDKFVEQMVADAPAVRAIFEKEGYPIVETEDKTPEEVAKAIIKLIYI